MNTIMSAITRSQNPITLLWLLKSTSKGLLIARRYSRWMTGSSSKDCVEGMTIAPCDWIGIQ